MRETKLTAWIAYALITSVVALGLTARSSGAQPLAPLQPGVTPARETRPAEPVTGPAAGPTANVSEIGSAAGSAPGLAETNGLQGAPTVGGSGRLPAPVLSPQVISAVIAAQIRALVDRQLQESNFVLPAGTRLDVVVPSAIAVPPRCQHPVVEPVPGRKPPGNAIPYLVRCAPAPNGVAGASVTVAVRVAVLQPAVVLTRALQANTTIAPTDLAIAEGDAVSVGADAITNPADAVGRVTARSLNAGAIILRSVLRLPIAIRNGDPVRIEVVGAGFLVSSEAVAMQNAATGDMIRVKNSDGQVLTGRLDSRGVVTIDIRRTE